MILSVGYYFDATPALPILPPEEVSKGASGTIPRPDVSHASPERAAVVSVAQGAGDVCKDIPPTLSCSSASSSSGRHSVVIAQEDIDPLRADRGALDRVRHRF